MSIRKPHNHLAGYIGELKSNHPKLPGYFTIFDRDNGGGWITSYQEKRYGVAHMKLDGTVGGVVCFTNLPDARGLMKAMALGKGEVAAFEKESTAVFRCLWCCKDTKVNPCEHCESDAVVNRAVPHSPHWSRKTIRTVECKVCDREIPSEEQGRVGDTCPGNRTLKVT